MVRRIIGAGLLATALYVAWARIPGLYPMVLKATGIAVVYRSDLDKLAGVYLLTGVVAGFGVALIVLPHRKGRKG